MTVQMKNWKRKDGNVLIFLLKSPLLKDINRIDWISLGVNEGLYKHGHSVVLDCVKSQKAINRTSLSQVLALKAEGMLFSSKRAL